MVGFLKSIQQLVASILSDIPESLQVVFDFIWKVRWFLVFGWVSLMVYTMVTKMLPYLMWMYVGKSLFGGLFTLFLGR